MRVRNNVGGLTVFIILVAATISIVAYVVANGDNPVGPASDTGLSFEPVVPTTAYTIPGVNMTAAGGTVSTGQTAIYQPIAFYSRESINTVGLEVTTASGSGGSVARICIYKSGDNFQPTGTLVLDAGTVPTDVTGIQTIGVSPSVTVNPGVYLMLLASDVGFTLRLFSGEQPVYPMLNPSTMRTITNLRFSGAAASNVAQNGCPNIGVPWSTSSDSTSAIYMSFMGLDG